MKKHRPDLFALVNNADNCGNKSGTFSVHKFRQSAFLIRVIALICLFVFGSSFLNTAKAQYCSPATVALTITPTSTTQTSAFYSSGYIAFTFTATAGCTYYFSTCGNSSDDTYLRLYDQPNGGSVLVNADDNCGVQSQFTWICPTSGGYSVLMSDYSCASLTGATALSYSVSCPVLCAGAPNSGTATISFATGCPSTGFNLSGLGLTVASGITYQWQYASSAGGPWNTLAGATTTLYATSTPTTTYYRLLTTCSVSALTATSSVVSYSVVNPGPCVCGAYSYAAPYYTGDEEILSVTFGSMTNVSSCTTTAPGPGSSNQLYSNYTGFIAAPNVCRGSTVSYSVSIGTCGGWYGGSGAIYIDYNQNGVFTDPGELAFSNITYSATANTYVGSITIPSTAVLGTTRMRVMWYEQTGTVPAPSGTVFTWGEVEDYCVNILGAPTITASGGAVCPGQAFVITPSGAVTYTYTGPSGTLTGLSATVNPIANTVYTISGTGANGCIASGASAGTVAVSALQAPTLVIVASPTAYCNGGTSTISVSGANTYTWNTTATTSSIVVSPTTTTSYTVTGTGTNVCNGVNVISLVVNPIPTVVVTPASPTVCSLSLTNFTASGASTYTWNGTTSGSTIALTPTTSTTYTVVGTSAQGCISTSTVAVVTNTLPLVAISPASASVCAFTGITFTASGAATYTWNNQVNTNTNTVYQSANTNYTVVGTSPQGCKASATVAVTNYSLPVLVVSNSYTTICPGASVSIAVSGASTYTWSNASTSSVSTFTTNTPTQYTVTGTDALGCMSSTTGIISTFPPASITIVPATATVCALSSVNLTASGATSYTWSNGSTTSSVAVTPSVTTVYTVTGTDPVNGCLGSKTVNVVANPLPILTVSQSATVICLGAEASFTASGANTYTWTGGVTGTVFVASPTTAAVYSISGTSSQNCTSGKTFSLGVNQLPVVTILPANSVTICVNEVASFTASGGTSYVWSPGSTTGQVFTVTPVFSPGYYSVTVTDANNCSNTAQVMVKLNTCTGISEQEAASVNWMQVYPNPSNGLFTVEFTFDGTKDIKVMNSIGQTVRTMSSHNRTEKLDLQELSKGIYFVEVNGEKGSAKFKVIYE